MSARAAFVSLVAIGVLTHFIGLTSPKEVVFDEVHWGKSVSAYCCTGQRVFDVHPPHGKLLLTLGAVAGGYDGTFDFDHIGEPYTTQPVFFLRLVPALVGVLIAPLFFLFLRYLGASLPAAFLGGLMMALDNAMLLETRILVFDGVLVAAILGSLVALFASEQAASVMKARMWYVATGALAGMSVGTKFTGLVSPALILLFIGTRIVARRQDLRRRLVQTGIVLASAAVVYLGGWAIHFARTPNPGPADAFHPTTGRFFHDLWVVHRTMLSANFNMTLTHPDASTPLSWLFMRIAPFYWTGHGASIYLVGNPVVWWGSSVLLIVVVANALLMRVTRLRVDAPGHPTLWFPLVGFVISFVPFFGITRVLFLYHYLTPLVFAVAFGLLWLDGAGWIVAPGLGGQRRSYYAVILLVVVGFLLVSPLTYGFSAGQYDEWLAAFVRSWR
ncbi:MAG TPA: phospholipid carrier-dependent glycosyltransferase [Vicinamibacterales bacterium]|nr:phospholipid carrier-dependent glycosyltransferase [Vicinamibacterales bacterium]